MTKLRSFPMWFAVVWFLWCLVCLAATVGAVWIVLHFVLKYW